MLLQLRLAPGRKGLRKALGDVPSWVAFQDREKVEVGSHPFLLLFPFQTSYTYLPGQGEGGGVLSLSLLASSLPDLAHIPVEWRGLPAGQGSSIVTERQLGLAPCRDW